MGEGQQMEEWSFLWFSRVSPEEWQNGGMAEWRNGGTAEWQIVMDNGPSYSSQIELEEWQMRQAARSSCAVLGPCFVNRKKVQSFTFPGTMYIGKFMVSLSTLQMMDILQSSYAGIQ